MSVNEEFEIIFVEEIVCAKCFVSKDENKFDMFKGENRRKKICIDCAKFLNKNRHKYKCVHDKDKYTCYQCKVSALVRE